MSLPLVLAIQSSYVRIAFRVYFTVGFIVTGFLANVSLARRNRRKIANGNQVPLTAMTGWLSNASLLTAICSLRRFPGGAWLGTLMLMCTILSYLSDLAVSGLVRTVTVGARCPFGTGLVVASSLAGIPDVSIFWQSPPSNGAPYVVVQQAQLTSAANGGMVGVYWKANRDLTFRADTLDVAGQWNCTDVDDDIYYYPTASLTSIAADLFQRGYLYRPIPPGSAYTNYGNQTTSHLILLDSSAPLYETGVTFDVRASIDMTGGAGDSKLMKSFHCTMNGSAVEWVLLNLNSSATLRNWCGSLPANVYDGTGTGAKNDTGLLLEEFLNSIVMVAGGNNYLLSTPSATGNGGGNTQGCLAQRTSIPVEIIILFALVTIFVLGMLLDLVILAILSIPPNPAFQRLNSEFLRKVKRETPNDLVGWMSQAARERGGWDDGGEIGGKILKLWVFGRRQNGARLGVELLGHQRSPSGRSSRRSSWRAKTSYFPSAIDEEEELRRYS